MSRSSTPPPPGRRRSTAWLLGVVAVAALVLDIVTKVIVVATLTPGRPVHLIGDFLTFKLLRNSGAAFSMATGYTWILTAIAIVVVGCIIRYSARLKSAWWAVALGLIVGGACGNLVDRLFRSPGVFRGHVVDFISVGWWPIFNAADSAVCVGAAILVVLTFVGIEFDGTRTKDKEAAKARAKAGEAAPDDATLPTPRPGETS